MPAAPAAVSMANHTRNNPSASSGRSVPPPPPSAPPAAAAPPREPQYRVLYDFNGQSANEITMAKDELVTILQKENNGKLYIVLYLCSHANNYRMVACKASLRTTGMGSLSISQRRSTPATATSCPSCSTHASSTPTSGSKIKWSRPGCPRQAHTSCPPSKATCSGRS